MPIDIGDKSVVSETKHDHNSVQFVVGIGSSAGGLQSIEKLLRSLTTDTKSAFVIVQHMSPDADSSMDEILARFTTLNVVTIEEGMKLSENTIFLIPPAKEIRLRGHVFELSSLDREQIARPIDTFFRSLAESYGQRGIGIVLSGTGSDGAEGIKSIQEIGGATLSESPDTAQFDGMPLNAIATECVDMVLPAEEIAMWLNRQFRNPEMKPPGPDELEQKKLSGISLIFSLLAENYDIEFSFYKPATVARRIERRQQVNGMKSILDYAEFLRGNLQELNLLYHDLLIGVTKFFRDTDAFLRLEQLIHQQISNMREGTEYRVWVAGCATGEEAYSIAMLCTEAFEAVELKPKFKIFATDVHGGSLDHASKGIYDAASLEFVTIERQQKFFIQDGPDHFRVNTALRRNLVFARHNVVQDPPFTKMDLVTCRNLLIYLKPEAQYKTISSFHFALKQDCIMFMGASESPGQLSEEFDVIDETWKLYRKLRDLPSPFRSVTSSHQAFMARPRKLVNLLNNDRPEAMSFTALVEGYDLILNEFIQSGLLLDDKRNVLHVFGDANRYLKSGSGRFSGSIMNFLSGDSKIAIAAALIRASTDLGKRIVLEDLQIPTRDETVERVTVIIKSLVGQTANSFVWFIAFMPSTQEEDDNTEVDNTSDETVRVNLSNDAFAAMESELLYTKESLSASIEQLETSNEELQAANEQLVAANEELQSTNQELHSVNEELYSVNAENQRKIGALEEMTDDVDNLLASTDIGIVFLDANLCIRKFTYAASEYIKLLASDVGRNITDFATQIVLTDLYDQLQNVIDTGAAYSTVSKTKSEKRILIRITPYMSNHRIKGVILNFIDLHEGVRSESELLANPEPPPTPE